MAYIARKGLGEKNLVGQNEEGHVFQSRSLQMMLKRHTGVTSFWTEDTGQRILEYVHVFFPPNTFFHSFNYFIYIKWTNSYNFADFTAFTYFTVQIQQHSDSAHPTRSPFSFLIYLFVCAFMYLFLEWDTLSSRYNYKLC